MAKSKFMFGPKFLHNQTNGFQQQACLSTTFLGVLTNGNSGFEYRTNSNINKHRTIYSLISTADQELEKGIWYFRHGMLLPTTWYNFGY